MDERYHPASARPSRRWVRYLAEGVAVVVVLLCIFHRPILHAVVDRTARHFAAKANLKINYRIEGGVLSDLVIRNLHIVPIGPTIVESIDADYVRADYALLDFLTGGVAQLVKNVEVRGANVVLNPATAAVKANVPPDEPLSLPKIFPDRIQVQNVNVVFRDKPQDFLLEGLDLELDARHPSELHIAKLQLPTTPPWTNISGRTSYLAKKMELSDVVLDQTNRFRELMVDASHIGQKQLGLTIDGSLANGTIVGTAVLTEKGNSLDTKLHTEIANVSLDTVRGYIGRREGELTGTVDRAVVDFSGVLDAPKSWIGTLAASIRELKQDDLALDNCTLAITAKDGVARIDLAEFSQGLNKVKLRGNANLPNDVHEFGRSPAVFDVNATLPDLHGATAMLAEPITGAANVSGKLEISNAQLVTDLSFNGGAIGFGRGVLGQATGTIRATKQMPPPNMKKPWFADLRSETQLTATDLRAGEWLVDRAEVKATSVDDLVTFEDIETVRTRNTLVIRGDYRLPEQFGKATVQPANISLEFAAVELADFFPPNAPNRITGPLQLSGNVRMTNGVADGALQVSGSNIHVRELTIPTLGAQLTVTQNVVHLNEFSAKLNDRDSIVASGTFEIQQPYRYNGQLAVSIADLATLRPLLPGNTAMAGALTIDWQGSGTASGFKNSGNLKLALDHGRYGNMDRLQAKVQASYTPQALDAPLIFIASDKMDLTASMTARGDTLEVSNVHIDQGQAKYASGYISLPFTWSNLGSDRPLSRPDGKVAVSFQSENLDIKRLFDDLGQKAPATGVVSVRLDAKGTLDDLSARADIAARDLRSDAVKLDPASLEATALLDHNKLAINGRLQQAKIQPVQISANLPLNVATIVREKKIEINETPVSAKVVLPRSSLNFVRQFVPGLVQLDGDMALDVNVGGTIGHPDLSGAGDIKLNVARFENPSLPALQNLQSRLTFSRDTLTLERLNGQLAGGPFSVGGRVGLTNLTDPQLDFQIKADSVLIARNDQLTARADADIRITGPLKTAHVAGSVALTNSHFLKNIDLIPIGLPGRPAPQPPSDRPMLSFPQPPLRDWTFDVAIKTKDPFQIRGNLAHGGAISDLHLTGNGLRPGLEGQVRLENVEATLPFSRLEIAYGYLYFTPDDPLNPRMDLHGTSLIRDYTIHVYVYGTSLAPEAVFTSEPPLPQEEIISLLATGTTREELTGNNNVLAGRAAMLLVQQLYYRIFKKGDTGAKSNSIFDRLQLDVGSVDPRTGERMASARFRVNDQIVLVGDIGVAGSFRGIVKYLIRFR